MLILPGTLLGVWLRKERPEIRVVDTGPGFDAEHRAHAEPRLLAPFVQGGAATEGYGLGLHIVRTLCRQSGYRLAIRAGIGRGSSFGVASPRVG